MTRYAVMIPWDNEGYIYVTRPTGEMYELEPVVHETFEEASQSARIWGKYAKVVEYKETTGD